MKKHLFAILTICAILLIALSACVQVQATTAPLPALTEDPTRVMVAAQATVTAMLRQATATPPPAPQLSPTARLVTSTPPAAPASFWVTYLVRNKIAIMNSEGAQETLLTNTPGFDYLPRWSPDGQYLAFLRFDASNTDGVLHLLALRSDTPRQLDAGSHYNHFVWTPSSTQLLVTSGYSGAHVVWLLDVATGTPLRVADDVAEIPVLSPDGTKVGLLISQGPTCNGKGCASPNDVYLYDIASRQTTRLTQDSNAKTMLSWSPDGQQMAFRYWEDPSATFDLLSPDGAVIATRQAAPWWTNPWVRSPDGSRFAYFINDTNNGAVAIYTVDRVDGQPALVTRLGQSGDAATFIDTLRWRPDGTGLIFNVWVRVYSINLDGSDQRLLPLQLENVFFDVRPTTDEYTLLPQPTPPASWAMCPGALDTRLEKGRQAEVSTKPPSPNNVRSAPNKTSELVGKIQPGEKIKILDGPVCDNGTIWWRIQSFDTGIEGYTLEGDKTTYWLNPLP